MRPVIRHFRAALASVLLACLPATEVLAAQSPQLPGRVLRVIDGDTVDVRLSSGRIRVRLHGIDAPERDQPGGTPATQWLTARIHDREVLVEPVSQDQYQRMVAVLHLDGVNVNRELVREGHAWAYRRYLRRVDRSWCDVEAAARTAQRGLWGAPPARAPWEFRSTRGKGPFRDYSGETARDCRSIRPRL